LGALNLVFRAEARRRWRSWLALVVLIAIVGGVVLAAGAAGRRTATAFPHFVAAYGFDAAVYAGAPVPKGVKIPDVVSIKQLIGLDTGQPTCRCTHPIIPTDFGVVFGAPSVRKLVSGRLPNPAAPDEVLASFTLQQDAGVHLGSVIHVPLYAQSQTSAYNNATGVLPKPTGPTAALRVVGFEATEYEFPSGDTPSYDLYTTPAFARTVIPHTAYGYVYLVKLRHGAADLPRFDNEASALGGEASNQDQEIASVEASIHPQAVGWWILAGLAAVVGLAVVGQAIVRQSMVEGEDYPLLTAIGADRPQLIMLGTARNVVVGLGGAIGAILVATALSPIAPLGEARVAESGTGVSFDSFVLPVGGLAIVGVAIALGIWPAIRSTGRRPQRRSDPRRPSVVAGTLAASGAPPTAVLGVRNALERRSTTGTVPVGTAFFGMVLAVTALSGTAVFGASLSHLTATPRLYGVAFDLNFTNPNGGAPDPGVLAALQRDRAVSAITEGFATEVIIDKMPVGAILATAVRGHLLLSPVDGHAPEGDGQIGLGATTMHALHVHLGSLVDVAVSSPGGRTRVSPFRVASQISFPVLGGVLGLGSGSVVTLGGYANAACAPGPSRSSCLSSPFSGPTSGGVLASFVSGASGRRAVTRYLDEYPAITALPTTPVSLVNFGEAVNFPLIFGAMLAVSGAATLVHLLVVSVSRRRREIGLLKALGFVRSQVIAAVVWQATTLALVGVVIGVPLGLAVGSAVWNAFANDLGVVPVSVVQTWVLITLSAGVVVVANLLAVVPALAAARSNTKELLRSQ
jgi:FtsX-like permease family